MNPRTRLGSLVVALVAAGGLASGVVPSALASVASATTSVGASPPTYSTARLAAPSRTEVRDGAGAWAATFTDGSRSVSIAGPTRRFSEPTTTSAVVSTNVWVRLLSTPFAGTVDWAWLAAARGDTSADALAAAMQYEAGVAPIGALGGIVAGDASYGPLLSDGTRQAGADFNDYLGMAWSYPDGYRDSAEAAQLRSLDCSGFVRMVYGFRLGVPLAHTPTVPGALPRRAFEIAASGPGVVLASSATRPALPASLQAGDLVFFDASTTDGTQLDHVGIYLGKDGSGRPRFISSRQKADGPTLGDVGGASVLSGTGYWATAFRAVRRL